jgi:hypothetical protein
VALNKHKPSGRQAVFQTRKQAADEAAAAREPAHEKVPGGEDDVRIVVKDESGKVIDGTGWHKADQRAAMEAAWNAA